MKYLLKRNGKYFTDTGYTDHSALATLYSEGYANTCASCAADIKAVPVCDIKQLMINDARLVMSCASEHLRAIA